MELPTVAPFIIQEIVENGKQFSGHFLSHLQFCTIWPKYARTFCLVYGTFRNFPVLPAFALPLILELEIVNIHGIAVLDAHFLQTLEQAALVQLDVEVVPGLVVVEVDIHDPPLQPGAGDEPGAAQMLDLQGVGIAGLDDRLHILGLVDGDRGQGPQMLGDDTHQVPGALGGAGGDLVQLDAQVVAAAAQPLQVVGLRHQQVGLVGGHDHGTVAQIHAVIMELGADGVEVLHRVTALGAGHIHHMDQQTAAVDVPEEVMAQAGALGGAFDDAGDVRHDEGDALVHIDDAQVGNRVVKW